MSGISPPSHLTLILPGLFDEAGNDLYRSLETLLSRAAAGEAAVEGLEETLLSLFGVSIPEEADIPVAALCRLAQKGEVDKGTWLCADPVHFFADQSQVFLTDPLQLPVNEVEASSLIGELNHFYAGENRRFVMASPHRWFLHLPSSGAVRTTPLISAIDRPIGSLLPQGEGAIECRRLMNELQMLLHGNSVNHEREATGKSPINGLWLWGAGTLPEPGDASMWRGVWSGNEFARGLARLHGLPARGSPASFDVWCKNVGCGASSSADGREELLVFDMLQEPGITAEVRTMWLAHLERVWFAPLLAALQGGKIGSIRINTTDGRFWTLTPSMAKRWWRRRRPLADYRRSDAGQ